MSTETTILKRYETEATEWYKAKATKWLKVVRKWYRKTDMSYESKLCLRYLQYAELVPEDIGSSTEELRRMSRTSLQLEALRCLQWARREEDPEEIKCAIRTCLYYLDEAERTPIAIGSNTEELLLLSLKFKPWKLE